MRWLLRISLTGAALLVAIGLVAAFWLQDANRLKPELTAWIAQRSDYQVEIRGDLSWQLLPPLKLQARDIVVSGQDVSAEIELLTLSMDLSAVWEDIQRWKVSSLSLDNTTVINKDQVTAIQHFELLDFVPRQPAPFSLTATHQPERSPIDLNLQGQVTYFPSDAQTQERIAVKQTRLQTNLAEGLCDADLARAKVSNGAPVLTNEGILPVATLNEFDLALDCRLSRLTWGSETFNQAELQVTNTSGQLNTHIEILDFLGGALVADADVDTRSTLVNWTVMPDIENVDSERLLAWGERSLQWIAPVALDSTITMQGNDATSLANTIRASSQFDGGQGQLNISKIKQQLGRIAVLAGRGDKVANWPDVWDYESMIGQWQVVGPKHDMVLDMDNMHIEASGDYLYAEDTLDLLAHVTLSEGGPNSPFEINPLLQDTPIPIRCRGSAADPTCRVDDNAMRNIVANALQNDDDSGLRRKLEDKIDEEVPEEYRDTARSLLDLLGRALERD